MSKTRTSASSAGGSSAGALTKAVARIGGGALVSRLLGFARDLVIARLFGATPATDAFVAAFRLPNLLRRLFAEGAFAAALVPVLTRYQGAELDQKRTRILSAELAGSLSLLLLLITGLGLLTAPLLALALAPGFADTASQRELTVELIRLTLPYVFFIGLTALAGALLNSFERFALPALTPAVLNLALIGCAFALAPRLEQPILALGWGVLLGGMIQLALQLPALARLGLLGWPRVNWRNPVLRGLLASLGPTLIGLSISHINVLLDTVLASFLIAGSMSWLYYAERLMDFPLGLFGAALGTAILPRLARAHLTEATGDFAATLDWALRWLALLGFPAAAGLVLLAEPIMTTLFFSPQFDATDVRQAAWSLMAYALGLPGLMALKVLLPSFFSRGDTRTPLRLGLVMLSTNLLFSLLLMGPLGHAGLALGSALAATWGSLLLLRALFAEAHGQLNPGWKPLLVTIGCGLLVMMLTLWLAQQGLPSWVFLTASQRLSALAGFIVLGVLSYVLTLWFAGLRPSALRPPSPP